MQTCSEFSCFDQAKVRGLCRRHYMQDRRAAQATGRPLLVCVECGQEFEVRQGNVKFCSIECSRAADLRRRRDNEYKPPVIYCAYCSEQITYKSGRRRYCSDECRAAHCAETARFRTKGVDREFVERASGCALCGAIDRKLVIDHDHMCCPRERACGKCTRGMLCQPCNVGLGMLHDDPVLLRMAADYIERFRKGLHLEVE